MKPIVWSGHVKISTTGDPDSPARAHSTTARLTAADKAALLVLAAGLLALGGVLFAAGLVILLALAAAGVAVGGATALRHQLFGRSGPRLRPGEVAAAGEARSVPHMHVLPSLSRSPASPQERAPRAD